MRVYVMFTDSAFIVYTELLTALQKRDCSQQLFDVNESSYAISLVCSTKREENLFIYCNVQVLPQMTIEQVKSIGKIKLTVFILSTDN